MILMVFVSVSFWRMFGHRSRKAKPMPENVTLDLIPLEAMKHYTPKRMSLLEMILAEVDVCDD